MEENIDIKVERRLVGRKAYEYDRVRDVSVLEADSGFGDAGAKLDPRTGALMYDKYAETVTKSRIIREEEPIPEPEPQPQPQAQLPPEPPVRSEGIRISSDSNAMIHFKESEDVVLSGTGALKSQSTTGIVSVENLSDDDRLWDIFVKLREQTGIAELDFESINVRELEPRNKVSKDYKINLPRPSLTVQELISTDPNYPESLIIHQGQSAHVTFQLEVRNVSGIAYRDVIVRKELPKELKKLVVPERGEEIVKLEEGTLVWKLPELLPDDAKVLVFEGDLSAEDANNETTGEVEVEATGVDTITDFLITDYDAMCRNMYFIEADETDVSEQWLCNFICENTSSFEVEVLRVEVRDSLYDKVYMDLLKPAINVLPKNRWESRQWMVVGKDRPTFIKTLVFNVIPGLTKELQFKLTKEGSTFQEANLAFSKSFDVTEVVAGRVTDITAQIEIENIGTATLDQIAVRDLLPKFMETPNSFKVMRESSQLDENVKVFIQPEEGGADVNQQLSFFITDLTQFGGALAKGEKIVITYSSALIRPPPESKIVAFVEVDAKPHLPGPMITGDATGKLPAINTIQILRKFSIGKSIEQGTDVGEYNIGILYKNRGNQPIRDLVIKDILPRNFTGLDYSLEPEEVPTPEKGTVLIWNIPKLDDGETTTILYKIQGKGEYHATDAQVFYNTGGKLGKFAVKDELVKEEDFEVAPAPEEDAEENVEEETPKKALEDFKSDD